MKVTISVFGRFHAFNLAKQLNRRGYLNRLITSYPTFEVNKYGVSEEKIKTLAHYEVLKRGCQKIDKLLTSKKPKEIIHRGFEWSASRYIPEDTDVFVGWSGISERGLKRAKHIGATALLERGSGHIEHQYDLLKEEGERFGIDINPPSTYFIEKEKKEYDESEVIVIPSTFAKKSFEEYGVNASKIKKVPYGVDLAEFSQVEKKDDKFRIIYAGRMALRKGVHYLLKAFSELDLPNAELWLIGKKLPEITRFFRKYQNHFHHLGHKPQNELYKYYSQGTVFVLNSVEDGFGMVIPQAMACGLPAICTEHTGGPDIVRDGTDGFIIPPRDTEALKEKIVWCYEHQDECRQMGRKAKSRVQESFQWTDYGDRIIEKYSKLAHMTEKE